MAEAMVLFKIGLFVGVDYLGTALMRSLLTQWATTGSALALGGFETAYGVGQVGGSLILPYLSDRIGRRAILRLSCLGTALGYGLSAASVASSVKGQAAWTLFASRSVTGFTKQTLTMARAIVGDTESEPARRQAGMAILTRAGAVGYLLGPPLGNCLADAHGVPVPMLLVTLLFLALVPGCSWIPETAGQAALAKTSGGEGEAALNWSALFLAPEVLLALLAIACSEVALTGWTAVVRPRVTKKILPGGYGSLTRYDTWLATCALLGAELWRVWQSFEVAFLMVISSAFFAGGLALLWRTRSVPVLYVSAALVGIGISGARTLPAALLIGYAGEHRGAMMGILDSVSSLCRVLAPLLTGRIVDIFKTDEAGLALLVSLLLLSSLLLLVLSPWVAPAAVVVLLSLRVSHLTL